MQTADNSSREYKNIRLAFFLNLGFSVVEVIGGLLTNSLAILSDALHDLGDSLSLGLSWYLERISLRGKDPSFSYGYRRFSLLGALVNSIILVAGSLFILSEAIPRLTNPQPVHAPGMLLFAIVGVIINGAAVLRLRNGKSLNTRVIAWHLLEDVLGWSAVLVVSLVLLFKNIPILDPILSIGITVYVAVNVVRNLKQTLKLFLQGVPGSINIDDLEARLKRLEQVLSTHHTHVWSLDGRQHILSTHIVLAQQATREDCVAVKERVKQILSEFDIAHTTLEIEYEDEDCLMKEHEH